MGIATVRALGSQPRRNRQRRRAHEIVRLARASDLPELANFDIVISVRATTPDASFETLSGEFRELWHKAQGRLIDPRPEAH